MKASFLRASSILLSIFLTLGFIVVGCKKEIPPPQELTAKEKEFLSAPDVVTCELEKIKISKLDLPDGPMTTNFSTIWISITDISSNKPKSPSQIGHSRSY
jgi:hypothetical protein